MTRGSRDINAGKEEVRIRKGPTCTDEADSKGSSARKKLELIGNSLGEPTVSLSGLNVHSVKQSSSFAGAIFLMRQIGAAELATVPGE